MATRHPSSTVTGRKTPRPTGTRPAVDRRTAVALLERTEHITPTPSVLVHRGRHVRRGRQRRHLYTAQPYTVRRQACATVATSSMPNLGSVIRPLAMHALVAAAAGIFWLLVLVSGVLPGRLVALLAFGIQTQRRVRELPAHRP